MKNYFLGDQQNMKALIPATIKLSILFVLVNLFFFVTCQDNSHETEACDILIAYGK